MQFFVSEYADKTNPDIAFDIKYLGSQDEDGYRLTFTGNSESLADFADAVHRFMESFLDELYDESLEEDWLCELGCDELPTIIDYDVKAARLCPTDNNG